MSHQPSSLGLEGQSSQRRDARTTRGDAVAATLGDVRVGHGRGGGGRLRTHRDLTTGSIPKHLAHLAWPQVLENLLNIADQMVDLVWAGRLPGGFRAIAGLGVAQSFTQFSMTARQGLDQALRAMVLPLAALFAYGLDVGVLGLAYAHLATMGVRMALYVPYFFWGRWLRVKVI